MNDFKLNMKFKKILPKCHQDPSYQAVWEGKGHTVSETKGKSRSRATVCRQCGTEKKKAATPFHGHLPPSRYFSALSPVFLHIVSSQAQGLLFFFPKNSVIIYSQYLKPNLKYELKFNKWKTRNIFGHIVCIWG